MKSKLIAQVPYAQDKSYDFYADRMIAEGKEIFYEDIQGYGYLLTNSSASINFIPLGNSTSYVLRVFANDQEYKFDKSASNVMLFKNNKQRTVNVIFSEVVKCVDALIAPHVFNAALKAYDKDGYIVLASLTIDGEVLVKKSTFGTKELGLDEYGGTRIEAGRVNVYGQNGKIFYGCALSERNAPLIGPILDTIYESLYSQ